jgi:murein DD-endopeptidase MepM/ murein hydrolase activator NlpD
VNQEQLYVRRDSLGAPRYVPSLTFEPAPYFDPPPRITLTVPPRPKRTGRTNYPRASVAPARLSWFGSWTLVVVIGEGRFTRSVSVPRRLAAFYLTLPILAVAFSAAFGWYLQAYSLRGPMTQLINGGKSFGIAASRFTHFAYMARTKEAPTMTQLRRHLAEIRAKQLDLGTRKAAGRLLAGLVDQPWIDAASRYYSPQDTLQWPVPQGWFSRGWGSGEGGYHRAFDIMGDMGIDVVAAASGIVGYVGKEVSGYGNLVIIVHPRGWVTVYGHNASFYVVAGEYVHKGQPIAAMGSTGRSTGPHSHFEFIYRGKNCDPAPLFRPAVMHPNGRYSSIKQVTWPLVGPRPKDIQCGARRRHPMHDDEFEAVEPASDVPSSIGLSSSEAKPEPALSDVESAPADHAE